MSHHARYMDDIMFPEKLFVTTRKIIDLVHKYFPESIAIAVSGNSGNIIAGAISYKSGLPIISVRKKYEITHSKHSAEYNDFLISTGNYVIVDDFISSGTTVNRIINEIKLCNSGLRMGGVVLYADSYGQEYIEKTYDGEKFKIACIRTDIN